MPAERFFLDASYSEGLSLYLEGQEFHHLTHVMRGKVGESLELVNGRGELAVAAIQKIEKKQALLHIEKVQREPAPSFEVILAQGMPRLNRLDFILEKGTEFGMTQLWLFPAKFSERKTLTDHQLERMRAITIAAMKQCGRLHLPTIALHPPLEKWVQCPYPSFFGDVSSEAPVFIDSWKHSKGILFFVGPESGFSEDEEKALRIRR